MVFSSATFLFFFLPIVVLGHLVLPRQARNVWLLAASLLFYAWGSGHLVWLLGFSTVLDYAFGWIAATGRDRGARNLVRFAVSASVVANLGLLAWFKYANFFVEQVVRVGLLDQTIAEIALPVGISFFTFQSMSYTIDIARGRAERLRNPFDFGLYVSMFPQLVAGPIVRYHEISDQLVFRQTDLGRFADGAVRFAHGLAKKVLIADAVGPVADAAFNGADLTTRTAWIGVLAYTVQIYFDFSGYSDMAIGLGLMLGFTFPENFNRPYSASSVTDFWRRWHITLSNWFRDYLYIPLGGSRNGRLRTTVSLWAVFLLTGFWHGANWTFIVWGAFHGSLLTFERLAGLRGAPSGSIALVARRAYVLAAVMIGWVFFRSTDVAGALDHLAAMFGAGSGRADLLDETLSTRASVALVVGTATVLLPASFTLGRFGVGTVRPLRQAARLALVGVAYPVALVTIASGGFSPFLYFQF